MGVRYHFPSSARQHLREAHRGTCLRHFTPQPVSSKRTTYQLIRARNREISGAGILSFSYQPLIDARQHLRPLSSQPLTLNSHLFTLITNNIHLSHHKRGNFVSPLRWKVMQITHLFRTVCEKTNCRAFAYSTGRLC